MPAGDPWRVLGLAPGAGPEEIRAAFRRLALRHHPDLNDGAREAELRFREIAEAYRRLSIRAAAPGEPAPEGLLARVGRGAGAAAGAVRRAFLPGDRTSFTVAVSLAEAFAGCEKAFLMERRAARGVAALRSTLLLPVPAGSRNGDRLGFSWRGGQAEATVSVAADPLLVLEGEDLACQVPVPLPAALAGGTIAVPGLPASSTLSFGAIDAPAVLYRRTGGGWPRAAGGRGDALYRLWVEQPARAGADLADPSLYPAHLAYLRLLDGGS